MARVASLFLFILLVGSIVEAQPIRPRTVRTLPESIMHGGVKRSFLLHVPRSYSPDRAVPLVVALHGDTSSAREMEELTRFNPLSAQDGFIVVYPEGVSRGWNDGLTKQQLPGRRGEADDVGYLAQIVAVLSSSYRIDPHRVYLVGYDEGAMMGFRAICELPGLFAGIASVMGTMPLAVYKKCVASEPISVLLINGAEDRIIPLEERDRVRFRLPELVSVEQTARFWADANRCAPLPSFKTRLDLDVRRSTFAREAVYPQCRSNTQVMIFALHGSGHSWPAATLSPVMGFAAEQVLGASLPGQEVTDLVWRFLARQQRDRQQADGQQRGGASRYDR